MNITLEWLGVSTFRLTLGETVVFLDAYMDRVAAAPPIGLASADVTKADWIIVGHSHFDHLAGADVIAKNTAARIIGSNETCRVMRACGVGDAQLLPSQGGERHQIAPGVTVRVFPSLHACTWIHSGYDAGFDERGHEGLTEDERNALHGLPDEILRVAATGTPEAQAMLQHVLSTRDRASFDHGGVLVYLIETPEGSIFYQDGSGCWTGVIGGLRPDVAILAASGRGNVDGEPMQGSLAELVAMEAELMRPTTIVLAHHDDWLPPVTKRIDTAPIRAELAHRLPAARLLEPEYLDPIRVLGA